MIEECLNLLEIFQVADQGKEIQARVASLRLGDGAEKARKGKGPEVSGQKTAGCSDLQGYSEDAAGMCSRVLVSTRMSGDTQGQRKELLQQRTGTLISTVTMQQNQ